MKLRTTALVLILAVAFAVSAVAAAGAKAPGGRVGADAQGIQLPRVANALGLTQEQVTQIRGILQKFHADVKAAMESDIPPADKRTKMIALRTAAGGAIMAVLTPEQQEKARKMNLIERLLSPRKAAARGILWALRQLNLTEQQKADVKAIMQDSEAKAKAIRQDPSLTPEQKRPQLQALHKETMDKIVALLTAEQRQQLRRLLAKGSGG